MVEIAASILGADLLELAREVRRAERAGVDLIHVDVMDGYFAPNLGFGPQLCKQLAKRTWLPMELHLMVMDPGRLVENFLDIESLIRIILHAESRGWSESASKLKDCGIGFGLGFKLETQIFIPPILPELILLMSVPVGFAGQKFDPRVLSKISQASQLRQRSNPRFLIEVDGGIDSESGAQCIAAGADILASGAYLFGSRNMPRALAKLRNPWSSNP